MDLAARDGIDESRVVPPGRAGANLVQFDMLQLEILGTLVRFGGAQDQMGVVADDLIHFDFDLAGVLYRSRGVGPAHFPRRNVDCQTFDPYRAYVHWLQKEPGDPRVKREVIDRDQWLLCSRGYHVFRRIDAQALAGDFQAMQHRDAQAIQRNPALKSGAERLNDALFQNGSRTVEQDGGA